MRILRTLLLSTFTLFTVAVSAQNTDSHGFMGIVPGLYSDPWTGKGAPIEQILDNTPAAAAGMVRGDVITAINGKAVSNGRDIVGIVANLPVGQNISVTYLHKGEEKTIEMALAPKGSKSSYDYTVVRSVQNGKVWWTFQDDNTRVHIVDVNNVEMVREVGSTSVELRYNRAEFNDIIKSHAESYQKLKDK
jgi:membrane-associated protease RseP (regulator of RpoE activity)